MNNTTQNKQYIPVWIFIWGDGDRRCFIHHVNSNLGTHQLLSDDAIAFVWNCQCSL